MKTILWVIAFAIFSCAAYSQEHPKTEPKNPKGSAQKEQPGTEKNPLTVKILPAKDAEEQATKSEKHREEKAHEDSILTNATVWLAGWTTVLAVFTFFLWLATSNLVKDAKETSRKELRAYIKLSHTDGSLVPRANGNFSTSIEVKNHGSTPGEVTDLHSYIHIIENGDKLPDVPDAERGKQPPVRVFLTANDYIFYNPVGFNVAPDEFELVKSGELILNVVAHVDYRDAFGVRHRAGYARQYIPGLIAKNLTFVTQPGYNYDRQRKKGEGNDWDEPDPA